MSIKVRSVNLIVEILCCHRVGSYLLTSLVAPISCTIAILSLRFPISRDTFTGRLVLPQIGAIHPLPWYLVSHRYICAMPHFATYGVIIVRSAKTSTNESCDTIATSTARYEKYRSWASKITSLLLACFFFRRTRGESSYKQIWCLYKPLLFGCCDDELKGVEESCVEESPRHIAASRSIAYAGLFPGRRIRQ